MRILIAEDVAANALLLAKILEPYGEVVVARTGEQAVREFKAAQANKNPFELVMLDILMPDVDGQHVLRELRAYEEGRGILGRDGAKVVFVTALNDPKNLMTAFKGGCEAYLTKPLDRNAILEILERLQITPKSQVE